MNSFLKNLNIKEDETVVQVIRRYPLTHLTAIIFAFILVGGPFFFLYSLMQWERWGLLVFAGAILIGLLYIWQRIVVWRFNALVITNQRLIDVDQRGFFNRLVSEIKLEKIQDIAYQRKGVRQTIFNYGTLIIQPANLAVRFEIRQIKDPADVQDVVNDLIEKVK